jgi:hypothetical protein
VVQLHLVFLAAKGVVHAIGPKTLASRMRGPAPAGSSEARPRPDGLQRTGS